MNMENWMEKAHRNAGWLVALGILQILLGVVAVGSPLAGGLVVTMVLGVSLIISGIARLFAAFAADSFGAGTLAFVWGLLVASTGFYIFTNPGLGLATLTLAISLMLFVSGLAESVVAFHVKPQSGWGWILFGGLVSVILAIMVWLRFPISGIWLVGTLVGIHLLVTGIETVMIGSAVRRRTATV
ncbi:MAG: HdeD family acid-resistance protein [Syntrophotaleaceae bacterium]